MASNCFPDYKIPGEEIFGGIFGGGNSRDAERIAEDLRRHEEQERQRRAEEMRRFQDEADRQSRERAALRRAQKAREEALEREHQGDVRAMFEAEKKARAEELARQDQLRRDNEQTVTKTIEDNNAALDRQRNQNQQEATTKTDSHQALMNRRQKENMEVENKLGERVVVLSKEKENAQEKLHLEKSVHYENQQKEIKAHNEKLEILAEQESKILLEREQQQITHRKTMDTIEVHTSAQRLQIENARNEDGRESNFVDVVNNTRSAMTNLSNSISSMGKYAYSLVDGAPIPAKKKTILNTSCSRASTKIQVLEDCASQIRSINTKDPEGKVVQCQSIALKIGDACGKLSASLGPFEGSLDTSNDCRKYYEQVVKDAAELSQAVNSLPVLSKSNYAINAITRHMEVLAASANGVQRLDAASSNLMIAETED